MPQAAALGICAAFAGGRPRIKVNSWTGPSPAASTQPDSRVMAAFEWARLRNGKLRQVAILAVLAGAGQRPDTEYQLGQMLREQAPEEADELGLAVVQALDNEKCFEAAMQFTGGATSETNLTWLGSIFHAWGASDPVAALQRLQTVDPALRETLFQTMAKGWSVSRPAALGDYALSLPSGEDRSFALSTLSEQWSLQDPAAMADWLAGAPRSADLEPAVAAMLTRSDGANRPISTAVTWAETINDPALHFSVTKHLMREWVRTDASTAEAYVRSASWLTPPQRAELWQIMGATTAAHHFDS